MLVQPALDAPPLTHSSEPVIAFQLEAVTWPRESGRQGFPTVRYETGNALATDPQYLGFGKDMLADYRPKTELGRRLLNLRRAYVASGGRLLTADALDEELRSRRGGVSDA